MTIVVSKIVFSSISEALNILFLLSSQSITKFKNPLFPRCLVFLLSSYSIYNSTSSFPDKVILIKAAS